jgi:hypothetical protein
LGCTTVNRTRPLLVLRVDLCRLLANFDAVDYGVHLAERAQLFLRPKLLHAKFARVKPRNCWKLAAEMACLIE